MVFRDSGHSFFHLLANTHLDNLIPSFKKAYLSACLSAIFMHACIYASMHNTIEDYVARPKINYAYIFIVVSSIMWHWNRMLYHSWQPGLSPRRNSNAFRQKFNYSKNTSDQSEDQENINHEIPYSQMVCSLLNRIFHKLIAKQIS